MKTVGLILALIVGVVGGVLAVADYRWRSRSARLVDRLARGAAPRPPAVFSVAEIEGLPAPVAQYFKTVLRDGQPLVRQARLEQRGEFLLRPPEGWRPFRSTEHLTASPAGFVWDARIGMGGGLAVRVRDAFVDGTGSMHATLQGLFAIVSVEGTPDIAAGALHRYLAEATWCPTALLPSQGVVWTPIDDTSARAELTVGETSVWLDFHFGADNLVQRVFTPGRARDVGGRAVPTPWQGRWFDYGERGGMRIPLGGEVEWILPEGRQVYWRGRVTGVAYE